MAMNILKVGSCLYYNFRFTLYTAKAPDAVKLFGPRSRRRKASEFQSQAGFKLGRKIGDTQYLPVTQ